MPTTALRDLLGAIWALLYEASKRELTPAQRRELLRLLDLLEEGAPANDCFTDRALDLSLAIRSSGMFDAQSHTPIEDFLRQIDEMRSAVSTRRG
jgi:hypothetical protein